MKLSQAKEVSELLAAVAAGKTLQWSKGFGSENVEWHDIGKDESFQLCEPMYYRIKPEKKLRAWKPEEVPIGAIARLVPERKERFLIIASLSCTIYIGLDDKNITYDHALRKYEHSLDHGKTWLPCGVEE